ncbi:hypothetical protein [Nocardia sp. NBC_01327]|uniref:hypothetical protein n=1 Tax=Nocardia sp. NBC_01327 TaxID=2903593 RepID=UPI002E0D82C5|nr:hypothetical protein OG326_26625 [Nocardia sp. NBC_01327]
MTYIRAVAVRYEDDHFPGWVEAQFEQADGSAASFVAKVPEFQEHDQLTCDAVYPIPLEIECDLVSIDRARRVATIDLCIGIGLYEVSLDQLGSLPDA